MAYRYWREFDPRKTTAYEVTGRRGKLLFSSKNTGLGVIDAVGLDWNWPQLEPCFRAGGSHGFVAVNPWYPGAKALASRVREITPTIVAVDDVDVGVFDYEPRVFEAAMLLRERSGGWASGDWCLGTCADLERMLAMRPAGKLKGFPGGWLLARAEGIGCALALAEGQSLLTMRIASEMPPIWDSLVGTLPPEARRP